MKVSSLSSSESPTCDFGESEVFRKFRPAAIALSTLAWSTATLGLKALLFGLLGSCAVTGAGTHRTTTRRQSASRSRFIKPPQSGPPLMLHNMHPRGCKVTGKQNLASIQDKYLHGRGVVDPLGRLLEVGGRRGVDVDELLR